MVELREVAEQVLFAKTLDEKLLFSPKSVSDEVRECGVSLSGLPGRPNELQISERGTKLEKGAEFPGTNKMDDRVERGKMLHFLANHELLATELMALVLLKFPNAPKEFRMGVYETMKEEQAHTLMYMRRMKECGTEFGQLPVNDYFWRMVAPMECPMDFVSRLSLVFEQANLDFSLHYAKLFREVGDTGTAAVLDKIYQDEIGHVGHGLKWFRKWKEEGLTDWAAFKTQLHFPLTLARAKGMAPYNAAGRLEAGLDEEWVKSLEVIEQSRGRTPIVHWFNPNEELAMAANIPNFHPKKRHKLLETDLGLLPLAWARRDDVVLTEKMPSREHLINLRDWGFPLPEFIQIGGDKDLLERKLGGLRPWAWGPQASKMMQRYAGSVSKVSKLQWREPVKSELFSKRSGLQLAEMLDERIGKWCESEEEVLASVREFSKNGGDVLMKSSLSSAGRGHHRLEDGEVSANDLGWVKNVLKEQAGIVVEPWLERVLDFSAQYEVREDGVKWMGMTRVLNDAAGRYLGTLVHTKWASGLDEKLSKFLFNEMKVMQLYREKMPELIREMVDDSYRGNFGIDAMVYLENGEYKLRTVVEINPRVTMGRVALELLRKTQPGKAGLYQIVRKSGFEDWREWVAQLEQSKSDRLLSNGSYPLNDPEMADEFIAIWNVRSKVADVLGLC